MAKAKDSARFFNVENVPVDKLDALLFRTEMEGHRLEHIKAEKHSLTDTYRYTCFFERKPEPPGYDSSFATAEELPRGKKPPKTQR